jgi:hypothetical protein
MNVIYGIKNGKSLKSLKVLSLWALLSTFSTAFCGAPPSCFCWHFYFPQVLRCFLLKWLWAVKNVFPFWKVLHIKLSSVCCLRLFPLYYSSACEELVLSARQYAYLWPVSYLMPINTFEWTLFLECIINFELMMTMITMMDCTQCSY